MGCEARQAREIQERLGRQGLAGVVQRRAKDNHPLPHHQGGRAIRVEINEVVTQERKPAWKPLSEGQGASDAPPTHSQDTEEQYAGDWSNFGKNGMKKLWADEDPEDPMDDWDSWIQG